VGALGDIQLFRITSESAVAAGVRRIEALTGEAARLWLLRRDGKLREAATTLKTSPDEVPARVAALVEERRRLERELAGAKKALAMGGGRADSHSAETVAGKTFYGLVIEDGDPRSLRSLIDEKKKQLGSGVIVLVASQSTSNTIAVGVTDDLVPEVDARELVRAGVAALGGQGGGGRPDMAQGGGPAGSDPAAAIQKVKESIPA
jgi:alanyl-tRNA synthetase